MYAGSGTSPESLAPVSYTHLDVYKRQILQIENMISRILSAFSPKNLSNTEILTCELSLIAMLAVRKDIHTIKTLAISSDHVGV